MMMEHYNEMMLAELKIPVNYLNFKCKMDWPMMIVKEIKTKKTRDDRSVDEGMNKYSNICIHKCRFPQIFWNVKILNPQDIHT